MTRHAHNYKDHTGERHGRVLVLRPAPEYSQNHEHAYWWCRCDCGTEFPTAISSVIRGKTVSCGCYRAERARALCQMAFRKCIPCEAIFPDGRRERYPSSNLAHKSLGLSASTICNHIASGKPTRNGIKFLSIQ
jgi:hypothetical protein